MPFGFNMCLLSSGKADGRMTCRNRPSELSLSLSLANGQDPNESPIEKEQSH